MKMWSLCIVRIAFAFWLHFLISWVFPKCCFFCITIGNQGQNLQCFAGVYCCLAVMTWKNEELILLCFLHANGIGHGVILYRHLFLRIVWQHCFS